jgi:hypothetical protein
MSIKVRHYLWARELRRQASGDALHAGWPAYMDSPLEAPGSLGGSLLVQLCIEGAQLAFTWFSRPV